MDKLAFTALASINNQANMRAQITNSLANVSTIGFKDTFSLAEQSTQIKGEGLDTRVLPGMPQHEVINLSPGALNMTGKVMDVALKHQFLFGPTRCRKQGTNQGHTGNHQRRYQQGHQFGVADRMVGPGLQ